MRFQLADRTGFLNSSAFLMNLSEYESDATLGTNTRVSVAAAVCVILARPSTETADSSEVRSGVYGSDRRRFAVFECNINLDSSQRSLALSLYVRLLPSSQKFEIQNSGGDSIQDLNECQGALSETELTPIQGCLCGQLRWLRFPPEL